MVRRVRNILVPLVFVLLVGAFLFLKNAAPLRDLEKTWVGGAAKEFNVVLVTLDTTRADRIGCYGYKKGSTPTLDRLASEGVRFANAISCVPMTLPAHASILTGLDPPEHGVRSNGLYRLSSSHVTLAETLQGAGYQSAAFLSAFVLDARYGLAQGFDLYDANVESVAGSHVVQRPGDKVTDAALDWFSKRDSSSPYFLWVHYFDPHLSYSPPEPFRSRFRKNPYDGEIAFMDSQLDRLIGALESGTDVDRTLLVVVGDHGESLGEHHETEHSRTIYDSTQHVPLILWSPGIGRQAYLVDDVAVSITDVTPTVLDLLGIASPSPLDGLSLLKCRSQGNRPVYMETMRTYLDHGWAPLFGLRRHRDKYIIAPNPEYYDLENDPDELNNLYATLESPEKGEVSRLASVLAERISGDPIIEAQLAHASAVEPDADALRRLEALGYVSGDGGEDGEGLSNPKLMMPVLNMCLEAKLLRQKGNNKQALAVAAEALEQSPGDRTALREIGLIYVNLGRVNEAKDAFKKYLAIKPDADVCWMLAQIYIQTGRTLHAKSLLEQALELEADHGGALIASGDIAAAGGKPRKALQLYRQAKELDPYRAAKMADARIQEIQKEIDNP